MSGATEFWVESNPAIGQINSRVAVKVYGAPTPEVIQRVLADVPRDYILVDVNCGNIKWGNGPIPDNAVVSNGLEFVFEERRGRDIRRTE